MKLLAEDDKLTVIFEGWEAVWALRRQLVVSKYNISSLKWMRQFSYQGRRLFRMGGTGMPGVLYAGNFRSGDGWYFLYLRNPKGWNWLNGGGFELSNVLDIKVEGFRYRRILLSCDEEIGANLGSWWSDNRVASLTV